MQQALTFNDITLTPISHQNSLWIRSVELARALGYSDESSVGRIYKRNEEEFTPEMTQVIEMNDAVNLTVPARIFSLRGCHLVAMFARTPVAKAFRRWVLDVLEKYAAEQAALSPAPGATPGATPGAAASLPLSTTEDRKPLRALVGSWAQVSGLPFAACWNQLKAAFQLSNIKHLPQAWLPDAIAFVQEKIDALPASRPKVDAATTETALGRNNISVQQDIMNRISRAEVSLGSAIEVMRLFGNPKAHPREWGNMTPEMASNLYNTAHAALVSAYNALEAAERMRHGRM